MEKSNENAVILFARDPILGQVKTRLSPSLNNETILKLYICFLKDSLAKIQQMGHADGFVGVSPENHSGFFNGRESSGMTLFSQRGKTLGDKMRQAFIDRFAQGYNKAAIIGSDSPSLPVSYIKKAFDSEKDLVLGPSTDGGFYLIAMKGKVSEVFSGVDWGTDKVLSEMLDRVVAGGFSFDVLPVWYDVDLPGDLKFLKTHLKLNARAGLCDGGKTMLFLDGISV